MTNNLSAELPKIESVVKQINDLKLGLALVWVYVWCVIDNYYDDSDYVIKDKETVWNALCEAVANGQGFTLEYGNESLTEHVYDWLTGSGLMKDLNNIEDEETDNQEEEA
jgi:hypothetical protein